MVKIYGSHLSSGRRCFWCLEEAGVKYEKVSIDMRKNEHKSPEFLKINPNGKVPALVDGELVLWESMAINFYIGDAYKQDLIGQTSRERAPVRQWSLWALADLQPLLIAAFIQLKFVPEERRDMKLVEKSIEKTVPLLQALDNAFTKNDYLVGNRFTLADLNVASVVEVNQAIDRDLSEFPKVERWLATVQERPAYLRLQAMD